MSGCVALRLPLAGDIVTWFVTASMPWFDCHNDYRNCCRSCACSTTRCPGNLLYHSSPREVLLLQETGLLSALTRILVGSRKGHPFTKAREIHPFTVSSMTYL